MSACSADRRLRRKSTGRWHSSLEWNGRWNSERKMRRERRVFAWQSFCKSLIASNEFIYLN